MYLCAKHGGSSGMLPREIIHTSSFCPPPLGQKETLLHMQPNVQMVYWVGVSLILHTNKITAGDWTSIQLISQVN